MIKIVAMGWIDAVRDWAAKHRQSSGIVDDSRETIYEEGRNPPEPVHLRPKPTPRPPDPPYRCQTCPAQRLCGVDQ